jgi:hypothetical protein
MMKKAETCKYKSHRKQQERKQRENSCGERCAGAKVKRKVNYLSEPRITWKALREAHNATEALSLLSRNFPFLASLCILGSGGFLFILPVLMIYCFSSFFLLSFCCCLQRFFSSFRARISPPPPSLTIVSMRAGKKLKRRVCCEEMRTTSTGAFAHLIYLLLLYLWTSAERIINFRVINHSAIIIRLSLFYIPPRKLIEAFEGFALKTTNHRVQKVLMRRSLIFVELWLY